MDGVIQVNHHDEPIESGSSHEKMKRDVILHREDAGEGLHR